VAQATTLRSPKRSTTSAASCCKSSSAVRQQVSSPVRGQQPCSREMQELRTGHVSVCAPICVSARMVLGILSARSWRLVTCSRSARLSRGHLLVCDLHHAEVLLPTPQEHESVHPQIALRHDGALVFAACCSTTAHLRAWRTTHTVDGANVRSRTVDGATYDQPCAGVRIGGACALARTTSKVHCLPLRLSTSPGGFVELV
jgi:hypothetical protein